MKGEMQGRVAIVTGAAGEVGRAVGQRLAASGFRLALACAPGEDGQSLTNTITAASGEAFSLPLDSSKSDDWTQFVERTLSRYGRVDVFVHAESKHIEAPLLEARLEDLRAVLAVELRGGFLGLKHISPCMRKAGGGSVIFISSSLGKVGAFGCTAMSAAHGGLRVMAKAAALELGPDNIRVNSLHPAPATGKRPLNRPAELLEIANVVAFLASDRSRFMTGAEIAADGGYLAQ